MCIVYVCFYFKRPFESKRYFTQQEEQHQSGPRNFLRNLVENIREEFEKNKELQVSFFHFSGIRLLKCNIG